MILGIDPKVDYAFKHLFGREASRPILIDVLNCVLQAPSGEQIRDLELLNPFNPKETLDDKLSILDIKARDQTGRQFNIEMQMLAFPAYDKRILYYASKLHQQQLHEGQDYVELQPTVSISFLNHVLFPDVGDYHLHFGLLEKTHHFAFNQDLTFHILELPKFKKKPEELGGGLDIWLYFLRHAEKMDAEALPVSLEQLLVKRALEALKMLTQQDIERERYEARRKAQLDHNSFMNAVQRERNAAQQEMDAVQQKMNAMQLEIDSLQRENNATQREIQEGSAKGEKIGAIHLCERMLNRPESPREQLASHSLDALTCLAEELQSLLIKR
ncbi:MAG TPA: Rpn family recombination-promoting nuclease/putative transposase [Gemmataceae bacterium]|nr:Rpn family recombination-promoting nuclease/putative transposase [Gemmataceae bacterium]